MLRRASAPASAEEQGLSAATAEYMPDTIGAGKQTDPGPVMRCDGHGGLSTHATFKGKLWPKKYVCTWLHQQPLAAGIAL